MGTGPVFSMDERENRMINLAMNQVEHQLEAGTAPPSVLAHFLRLGSTRAELELEKMRAENALTQAKIDSLNRSEHNEELYANAIEAMQRYSGIGDLYE